MGISRSLLRRNSTTALRIPDQADVVWYFTTAVVVRAAAAAAASVNISNFESEPGDAKLDETCSIACD